MRSAFATLACVAVLAAGSAVTPALAKSKPPAPPPAPAGPSGPVDADWRTPDPQDILVIDTTKGRILVELAPLAAPMHAQRLRELARAGFYDGRSFFRVLDNFMDQTGDPKDDGTGSSDKPNLQPEFTFRRGADTPVAIVDRANGLEWGFLGSLPVISQTMDLGVLTADHKVNAWGSFCKGVAGAARADDPASANSQFYLMRGVSHQLDKTYTAFGAVISGQDVVRAIKLGAPGTGAVDEPRDKMTKVQVLADMPEAQRPKVRIIDPRGAWFRVLADRARQQKVIDFGVCDVELVADEK